MQAHQQNYCIQVEDWLNPIPFHQQFPLSQPLDIDIGCGKGRFLLARAAKDPTTNYFGMDRMAGRIHKIQRHVARLALTNVRLLQVDAYYATRFLIPSDSVSNYYLFFPDPWPKRKHHKNRLFDELYIDALFRTMMEEGKIHVATDHLPYANDIEAIFQRDARFEQIDPFIPEPDERTDFELIYLDEKPIGRCSFRKK